MGKWVLWCAGGVLALSGCSGDDGGSSSRATRVVPGPTVTVTETVSAAPDGMLSSLAESEVATLPPLELEVYQDGCGVIRSETPPGVVYDNLTWSVRDTGGFQVLGRVAENETRYRYFVGGRYTVVLEAYHGGAYRTVSNEVTINC